MKAVDSEFYQLPCNLFMARRQTVRLAKYSANSVGDNSNRIKFSSISHSWRFISLAMHE
jgi:hypothetical protein